MIMDFKKKKTINIPIYPFRIHFFLLVKENEKYLESKHKNTEARTERDGLDIFIYFKENVNMNCFVHEIFHATEFIMFEIGQSISLSQQPNEAWAYLIGYLAEEAQKFIKNK